VGALTACKVGFVAHHALLDLCKRQPRICNAFWRETLIEAAIFREWLLNIGRRSAFSRIAHIFCELAVRMRAVGLATDYAACPSGAPEPRPPGWFRLRPRWPTTTGGIAGASDAGPSSSASTGMAAGIDLVHFGLIMVFNLMLGLLTPPVGILLYICANFAEVKLEEEVREVLPFLGMGVLVLLSITLFPSIVLWLPSLVLGR